MDQQNSSSKSKNTIFKFLTRATSSSVSFQRHSIDKKPSEIPNKSHLGIAFSGPMVTGDNTHRKINNDAAVYEPTSPRVSCMGQVKCKYAKDNFRLAGNKLPTGKVLRLTSATPEASETEIKSKKMLGFKKLFSGGGGRRKPDAGNKAPVCLDKAPSLSTMKRFSSGRDKLSDIDWRKVSGDRNYDSDEESDGRDVIIPSSAPVMIRNPLGFEDEFVRVGGNTEARKEINLWKRRTMPQPKPLRLNNI